MMLLRQSDCRLSLRERPAFRGAKGDNERRGVSLLEAIIAVSLLFITVAALHQMLTAAGRRSRVVRDNGFAIQLCQSKMNEVAAGAVALSSTSYAQVPENELYQWSMNAEQQGDVSGLWQVEIRVRLARPDTAEDDEMNDESLVVLRQFVLDPSRRGSVMDTANIGGSSTEPASNDSSGSTTPATGGGTTTTPAGGGTTTPPAGGGTTTRPGGR